MPTALIPTGVLPSISMKITTLFVMSAPSGVGATFTDADTPPSVLNDFFVTVKAYSFAGSCKSGTLSISLSPESVWEFAATVI
ncbi:hypothetical protein D3C71_1698660 [compost metagenome]